MAYVRTAGVLMQMRKFDRSGGWKGEENWLAVLAAGRGKKGIKEGKKMKRAGLVGGVVKMKEGRRDDYSESLSSCLNGALL